MKLNPYIAAAVAAAISGSAVAANYDIYVSGASAQRTFWSKDLQGSICGNGTLTTFKYFDSTITSPAPQPDYQAFRCTAQGTGLPGSITSGDIVTMHYAAELGSVWGVAGTLNTALTRAQLDPGLPINAACTLTTTANTYNCAGLNFDRKNDTGGGVTMVQHKSDILVYDVEPTLFAQPDNWPSASAGTLQNDGTGSSADTTVVKLGSTPSLASLGALAAAGAHTLNGQVFSVIGKLPAAWNVTNLSKSSLSSIFAGQYTTWSQVPEVGATDTTGTTITLCRRDHGSGTQVASNVFFEGVECGNPGAKAFASNATWNNIIGSPNLNEAPTSTDAKTCVTNTSGSIGIASLGTSSAYTTFNIDGLQANAHNAAAGIYQFAFETWGFDNKAAAANNTSAAALASALITDAELQSKLNTYLAETATLAAGQYTSAAPQVAYAIPKYNGAPTIAGLASGVVPIALQDRAGNSCSAAYNIN
jgi:ABC-type phosphate transport system substrate-binding protein